MIYVEENKMSSFGVPGFFCEFDQMYSDLGFGSKEGGNIKARVKSRRSSISGGSMKVARCKKCGKYSGKITFYNYEDGKLCKDCFIEMKRQKKEEEEK